MTDRRSWLPLALVLLAGLAIRLHLFVGPCYPDCFEYAQYAWQVGHGEFDITKEFYKSNRIGFLFPVGLMVALFGSTPFVFSLWGLLLSLGGIALAYGVAARLYDRGTGLLAAALMCVMPIDLMFWDVMLVESVTPFYWGLSIVLFHLGLEESAPPGRRRWLLLASGLVLGLAFYARIHAPMVFGFMLVYALLRRVLRRELLLVLVGFGIVALIAQTYYLVAGGEFFLRSSRALDKFGPGRATGSLELRPSLQLVPAYLRMMFLTANVYGYLYWLALPAAAYFLLRRERASLLPLTWLIVLYLGLEFGLRGVLARGEFYGYANVLTLPAVVLAAHFLRGPLGRLGRVTPYSGTRSAVAVGALLLAAGAVGAAAEAGLRGAFEQALRAAGLWGLYAPRADRLSLLPLWLSFLATGLGVYLLVQGLFARRGAARAVPAGAAAGGSWLGLGVAFAVFLLLSSYVVAEQAVARQRAWVAPFRAMAAIVARDRQPVYVTSLRASSGMNFYFRYDSNYRYYRNRWEEIARPSPDAITFGEVPSALDSLPSGAYVVLDKEAAARWRSGELADYDRVALPEYVLDPPPGWRLLYDSETYALYATGG